MSVQRARGFTDQLPYRGAELREGVGIPIGGVVFSMPLEHEDRTWVPRAVLIRA